ncbi:protein THALLO isoform X2 [Aristolochia californica]|uniref:protein THALLO isoform X2 n=1 Tax=Aristolochia californica TaxID=171875 RepID=UPI0035DFC041
MAKGPRRPKKTFKNRPSTETYDKRFTEKDMDDEIDAFHKQRDVVPLDMEDDLGDASDDDAEQPVFDFEDNDNDDDDDDDGDLEDDAQLTGLAAKIARQEKFMRHKIGVVGDEPNDDEEEKEGLEKTLWGRHKRLFYGYELQSSDEEDLALEEAEALRLQKERAKSLNMEDFGLEDADPDASESDGHEKTLENLFGIEKTTETCNKEKMVDLDTSVTYEEVKRNPDALTKEEQMGILLSSAPEVVGLLMELKDTLHELENKVDPLISEAKEDKYAHKGEGMRYIEVKQLLLMVYCQAISFYLLLKSEGLPVCDHPILARLVEINHMLKKMKQIDGSLPLQIDDILNEKEGGRTARQEFVSCAINEQCSNFSPETYQAAQVSELAKLVKVDPSENNEKRKMRSKSENHELALKSMEMMKVRAKLEENLKQKGVYGSIVPKTQRTQRNSSQPVNRQLETLHDFDDEITEKGVACQGVSNGGLISNISKLVGAKANKPKVVSGDDDLPARDDIGEKRRKYELKVLAKAGVQTSDFGDSDDEPSQKNGGAMDADDHGFSESQESEDEFYKEAKRQRTEKLSAKAELYARNPAIPLLPEDEVDGKRHITYQMEKNKGLTRARKKLTKIPRKKYKLKHKKAVVRRKGQVRDIRKPSGPYGGETTGINTGISRSIRFKS